MEKNFDLNFELRSRSYGVALYLVDNDRGEIRLGGFKSEQEAAEWFWDEMRGPRQ